MNTKTRILEAAWKLMELHPGLSVSMSAIAKEAGISRQAVYLHYASRTELIIATSSYVDKVKGLNKRFELLHNATNGIELLETCVDVWGNYIPEIYGLAKAMLMTRETDEATAAAWNHNMKCLQDVCRDVIDTLADEGELLPEWSKTDAVDMFSTMISINNWEQLTIESGWTNAQYIEWMKVVLKRTFIVNAS